MERIKAIIAGFRDGWNQPYSLGSSTHVRFEDAEWLDWAINWGQFSRAGFKSESWKEKFGFKPPFTRGKDYT